MKISVRVENSAGQHRVMLRTNDQEHDLSIAPKPSGLGSSVNGGELLFLALATCYCNDIYREAASRGISVEGVEVTVEGNFGAPGEGASSVRYHARVTSRASEADVRDLMRHTDQIAEIQNTLRAATPVELDGIEVVTPDSSAGCAPTQPALG